MVCEPARTGLKPPVRADDIKTALLPRRARLLAKLCGLVTGLHDEPRERFGRVHAVLDGTLDIVLLPEHRIAGDLHDVRPGPAR